MVAPVLKHRAINYLLRDLLNRTRYRCVSANASELAGLLLRTPIAIAHWIMTYHPELAERETLTLEVLNVHRGVSSDDGMWFDIIPFLLGNENLQLSTRLIGGNVLGFDDVEHTKKGTNLTKAGIANKTLKPAELVLMDKGEYMKTPLWQEPSDLVFIIEAKFSNSTEYKDWFQFGHLAKICEKRSLIGVSAPTSHSLAIHTAMLDAQGFSPIVSPTQPEFQFEADHVVYRQASRIYEIEPVTPEETKGYDKTQIEAIEKFERLSASMQALQNNHWDTKLGEYREQLVDYNLKRAVSSAALLPAPGWAVNLENGAIFPHAENHSKFLLSGFIVPTELVEQYAPQKLVSFEQLQWALKAMSIVYVGPDFQGDAEEVISKPDLLRKVRSLKGSCGEIWHNVLTQLGWPLSDRVEAGPLFSPAFTTTILKNGVKRELPVICENYRCDFGTADDPLLRNTLEEVQEKYTTALVFFRNTAWIRRKGLRYALGGLFFRENEWLPFYLHGGMKDAMEILTLDTSILESPPANHADNTGFIEKLYEKFDNFS